MSRFLSSVSRKMCANLIKPLKGVKVIELSGLAPVPHAGYVLADFGAEVTVVEKEGKAFIEQRLNRGKDTVNLNLKSEEDLKKIREMCRSHDVLLDPYRPGVLEKLGLDPVMLLEDNPHLIVCRLTGYGQVGPLSKEAGHDINYVAITGLLPTIAGHNRSPPWPPCNLLADFGGGGLTAAFGIVAALFHRSQNGGHGCIIDSSMVEGLSYLGSFVSHYHDVDYLWTSPYASFSGDCPIYRTYETKDGKFVAIGALEPQFSKALFKALELKIDVAEVYSNPAKVVEQLENKFKTRTRDEWCKIFEGKDACVTPVLELNEVGDYPHNSQRGTFEREGEKWIPEAAPKMYSAKEFKKLKSNL